ncbi:hypothetical protein BS17DRAFT_246027 [Gyrodon lividus]|nr:hypothetical protein BS17DRAFT_246027 [Gyrodon lividus]
MSWTFLRSLGHHQIHLDTCSLRRHIPYIPRALSIRHSQKFALTRVYSPSISLAYIKLLSRYECISSPQFVAFYVPLQTMYCYWGHLFLSSDVRSDT